LKSWNGHSAKRLPGAEREAQTQAKDGRAEIQEAMHKMTEASASRLTQLSSLTQQQLESVRKTVEDRLLAMQSENGKKLEEMRATVDEKLQSTLEKRLTESFRLVSERLEMVQRGLGEMQNLAVAWAI
jgi:DNA recombination protein RmuC